jgi:hypothetical protein
MRRDEHSEALKKCQRQSDFSQPTTFLRRRELGHSLGAFRDGMLGKLARKDKTDRSLNLARSNCGLLVVACQAGCLSRNLLEQVVDERVHDGHSPAADSCVGMNLLQDLVDVDLVCLGLGLLLLLLSGALLGDLLDGGLVSLGSHFLRLEARRKGTSGIGLRNSVTGWRRITSLYSVSWSPLRSSLNCASA